MEYVCCCFRRVKEEPPAVPLVTYNTFEVVQLSPPKPAVYEVPNYGSFETIKLGSLKPAEAGKKYEILVRNAFRQRGIEALEQTAGSTRAPDVIIVVNGKQYGVEVKSETTGEGGQKTFKFRDGRLVMEDPFFASFIGNYVPFEGRIPSFLLGDKTLETWSDEKSHFEDKYIPSIGDDAVARYYANKGSNYIYIESKGLYHTGEDPCLFGVPEFLCKETRVRIRCKRHSTNRKTQTHYSSVMAALDYKHPVEKSSFMLDV
jgi:hypothetical protein